jgi:hypothetical protein
MIPERAFRVHVRTALATVLWASTAGGGSPPAGPRAPHRRAGGRCPLLRERAAAHRRLHRRPTRAPERRVTYRGIESGPTRPRRAASPHRRRYTIGHEIGHHHLKHHQRAVHIDRESSITFQAVSYRTTRSAPGSDPQEVEANQFAACLMMPGRLVRREARKLVEGTLADRHIPVLAAVPGQSSDDDSPGNAGTTQPGIAERALRGPSVRLPERPLRGEAISRGRGREKLLLERLGGSGFHRTGTLVAKLPVRTNQARLYHLLETTFRTGLSRLCQGLPDSVEKQLCTF